MVGKEPTEEERGRKDKEWSRREWKENERKKGKGVKKR